MDIKQFTWRGPDDVAQEGPADLVLAFWSCPEEQAAAALEAMRVRWPRAVLFGCSTAGEILGTAVQDGTLAVTTIRFGSTRVLGATVTTEEFDDIGDAGRALAERLSGDDLRHVLVLSDGLGVNGSTLTRGLTSALPPGVTATGGLAGDSGHFQRTLVALDGPPRSGMVAAVGLYGAALRVGYGSRGGWDSFGPERLITRSEGNVLYEMDGESALSLYELYLGKHAAGLPATGLLFPLSIRLEGQDRKLVRTILSIDRERQSLTFAGDVPEGTYAQLMKANFDRLVDGASDAAGAARLDAVQAELALCISCVGRKLVLQQMVEEELEASAEALGPQATLAGFYSYGEIAPFLPGGTCELHNQTMTITTLAESD